VDKSPSSAAGEKTWLRQGENAALPGCESQIRTQDVTRKEDDGRGLWREKSWVNPHHYLQCLTEEESNP